MSHQPKIGAHVRLVLFLLFLPMFPLFCSAEDAINQHLSKNFVGKTVILRNFYSGDKLTYDSNGKLRGSELSGDWTLDGLVRVEKIRTRQGSLEIEGKRLRPRGTDGFHLPPKDVHPIRIEVDFEPAGHFGESRRGHRRDFLT